MGDEALQEMFRLAVWTRPSDVQGRCAFLNARPKPAPQVVVGRMSCGPLALVEQLDVDFGAGDDEELFRWVNVLHRRHNGTQLASWHRLAAARQGTVSPTSG